MTRTRLATATSWSPFGVEGSGVWPADYVLSPIRSTRLKITINRQLLAAETGQKPVLGQLEFLFAPNSSTISVRFDLAVALEVTELAMPNSIQPNMSPLYGWLIILAQSAVFFGIFFKLILLTYNPSHWYSNHDHASSWQSLREVVQFCQLGLVGFFLLIPEAELDRLTLRWTFLSLTFLVIAGQMADNNQRRKPNLQDSLDPFFSSMVPNPTTCSRQGDVIWGAKSGAKEFIAHICHPPPIPVLSQTIQIRYAARIEITSDESQSLISTTGISEVPAQYTDVSDFVCTDPVLGAPTSCVGSLTSLYDSSTSVEANNAATMATLGQIDLLASAVVPTTKLGKMPGLVSKEGITATITAAAGLPTHLLGGMTIHDLRPDAAGLLELIWRVTGPAGAEGAIPRPASPCPPDSEEEPYGAQLMEVLGEDTYYVAPEIGIVTGSNRVRRVQLVFTPGVSYLQPAVRLACNDQETSGNPPRHRSSPTLDSSPILLNSEYTPTFDSTIDLLPHDLDGDAHRPVAFANEPAPTSEALQNASSTAFGPGSPARQGATDE